MFWLPGSEEQVPGLEGDLMEDMMEDEEEFEVEGELDWSESHGESLTPSQHSQPGRGTMEEVCVLLLAHLYFFID